MTTTYTHGYTTLRDLSIDINKPSHILFPFENTPNFNFYVEWLCAQWNSQNSKKQDEEISTHFAKIAKSMCEFSKKITKKVT